MAEKKTLPKLAFNVGTKVEIVDVPREQLRGLIGSEGKVKDFRERDQKETAYWVGGLKCEATWLRESDLKAVEEAS